MIRFTYWTNTANFIWRQNVTTGKVSFWKGSSNTWSEDFNRAHCEAMDVEAGWGAWVEYTGAMPDGSIVNPNATVIAYQQEAVDAIVAAFVDGTADVSQHIVDTLGARKARFEVRETEINGLYGIWNPNRKSWVKRVKTDRTPAYFQSRDDAQAMCDRLNAKHGR